MPNVNDWNFLDKHSFCEKMVANYFCFAENDGEGHSRVCTSTRCHRYVTESRLSLEIVKKNSVGKKVNGMDLFSYYSGATHHGCHSGVGHATGPSACG